MTGPLITMSPKARNINYTIRVTSTYLAERLHKQACIQHQIQTPTLRS